MASDGQSLIYASYVGGEDFVGPADSMALDPAGNIYIAGRAFNPFLTLKNSFQKVWTNDGTAYFMKLDPTGRNVIYSSFFGSNTAGHGVSLTVDKDQNVYLSSTIFGDDLPVKNSLQPWKGGGPLYQQDAYLAKINSSGQSLAFAIDSQGGIYFITQTQSSDFPTKNAFQPKFGGGYDMFLMKLTDTATVTGGPLQASPQNVPFQFVQGGPAPPPQLVAVSGPEQYFLTTSPTWISATPIGSPNPPNTVQVTVNPSGLAPGKYNGSVVLHPQSGAVVTTLDVALTVLGPAPVITGVEPGLVQVGSDDVTITIRGSGFLPGAKLYVDGVGYDLTPLTVVNSQTATFTLPKLYFTAVTTHPIAILNPQAPLSNAVSVSVGQVGPAITSGGIVNAASYAPPPVAVGEIVVIYGTNFGDLAKAQILFDYVPATIIYATPTQMAATVPRGVANRATTQVIVQSGDVMSAPVTLAVAPSSPALFTADSSGTGQASALNQNYGINGATNPAERGSVIQLFGTGGGLLSREALPQVTLPISATIDGIDSLVQFAGAAPGLPEGVLQVNLFVPAGARVGSVPVVVKIGDATSNVATVAIK
jgi:uncharacterized protein (TIGR03437 family)